MRPIPAYKAGLYGLTEDRQLSESNSKPPFIPVHRTGHSGNFSKFQMKNGYWQRMLRIDLANRKTRVEEIPEKDLREFIGGAGLGAEILRRELPKKIAPSIAGISSFSGQALFRVQLSQAGRNSASQEYPLRRTPTPTRPLVRIWAHLLRTPAMMCS